MIGTFVILLVCAGEPSPRAHWSFTPEQVKAGILHSDDRQSTIVGRARLVSSPHEAMIFDGSNWIDLGNGPDPLLPTGPFSVEARVVIDQPAQWGGIFSALQDNGGFEQGWLLGYRGDSPCFALATTGADDGDGRMTYLVSDRPFVPGQSHHLVATWDGKVQRLYMDGEEVGSAADQAGEVLYPPSFPIAFGTYRDENEHYPMSGLVQTITLWDGVLSPDAIAERAGPTHLDRLPHSIVSSFDSGMIITGATDAQGRSPRPNPLKPVHYDGKAPDFVGRSYRVFEPSLVAFPDEQFSVEALVSIDRPLPEGGVLSRMSPDGRGWILGQRDGHLGFRVSQDGATAVWVKSAEPFVPGTWHHLVATYDGSATRLFVDGQLVDMTREILGPIQVPGDTPLVIGGRNASDDEGALDGRLFSTTMHDGVLSQGEITARASRVRERIPPSLVLRTSPAIRPQSGGTWEMEWETMQPGPSSVEWGTVFPLEHLSVSDASGTEHRVLLQDVPPDRLIRFRILGQMTDPRPEPPVQTSRRRPAPIAPAGPRVIDARSKLMEFDSAFDYSDRGSGYALVWGIRDGQRACELARRYDMQVLAIDDDLERVHQARATAEAAGLYGRRVRVHHIEGDELPYANYLFDHVTTEVPINGEPFTDEQTAELWRVVRPSGGILEIDRSLLHTDHLASDQIDGSIRTVRPPLEEGGTWTHQYGDAANTACSGDDLVKGDLGVLWWGRPGPRPMMDRGARTPAPLMANGRMFIQANRQLIAVNAYNGSILWNAHLPALRRVNVPRDCSNMVAGLDDRVYVAIDDRLWVLDAATGKRLAMIDVPIESAEPLEWGYIAHMDDHLLGSGVRPGSMYTGAEGQWYDAGGVESWRVTSDVLFSLDPYDHDLQWSHNPQGRLLNSTLTIADGHLYYVDVRDESTAEISSSRIGHEQLHDQYLVAVDLDSGRRVWESPIDIDHFDRMTYLVAADGALIVVGSSDRFHVLVFEADSGVLRWQADHAWDRDHHGGPLQHPVVVGNEVYVERLAYDLETGVVLREGIPQGRGCGTKTASNHLLFFRHYFHSFWDPQKDVWTEWTGTRGGCWLGLLPAGGIVLAPESSSGCSCTHAIQTSMAFIPRATDPTMSRTVSEE